MAKNSVIPGSSNTQIIIILLLVVAISTFMGINLGLNTEHFTVPNYYMSLMAQRPNPYPSKVVFAPRPQTTVPTQMTAYNQAMLQQSMQNQQMQQQQKPVYVPPSQEMQNYSMMMNQGMQNQQGGVW